MKYVTPSLLFILALSTLSAAQSSKPKSPSQDRVLKGTVQMAGDQGKLNTAYTIGTVDPINVTLTDIRFSVTREIVGTSVLAPGKDEKLLVVDFIAHNPNPRTISFSGAMLKFTGVDQESVNRVNNATFTRAKTGEIFYAELKPAQKVELRTVIVVPAEGTVPKLILEHRTGGPVLRVDLKSSLKPLPAVFAASTDASGMSASDIWNVPPDTYFPMPQIDIQSISRSVEKHGTRFGPNTVSQGQTFASVKMKLMGQSPQPAFLRFNAEFLDENGESYPVVKFAQISTEEHVTRRLEFGAEYTVRFVAVVPANVKLTTLKVVDTSTSKPSRTYVFHNLTS